MRCFFAAVLFAVLAALTGCAAGAPAGLGDHYDVLIDPALTPEQTMPVLAALDDWSSKTPVKFTPMVAPCPGLYDHLICIVRDDQGVKAEPLSPGNTVTYGFTLVRRGPEAVDGGVVHLDLSAKCPIQMLAAHELGHAMGLPHDAAGTLMSPHASAASPTVTSADAAQWYSLRQ